ncbi:pseudouridine synthase [Alcanivorax sp. 24]|uniref:pseudouridine synthase n=1 Tax=Alcanivorax sp. 24 TaxID=2545266 RepID=UPI001414CFA1|nr:pseudouridine synthase [Alcanivorax sp. 24]
MTPSGDDPVRLPRARQPEHYIVPRCHEEVVILHRDDHLLVVNKPAFLLSVPGRAPENKDCVIRRLAVDFPEIRLVHRLDLDTSGIMVFALTREAQSQLSRAFQQRRVFKEYQAVVDGLVEYGDGAVDLPLIADWPNRPLQKVCFETGKVALTQWKVLERDTVRGRTRLRLRPVTGRSHQLRIHCRELGHPILGCDLYAPEAVLAASERLLLHAHKLAFNHPHTGLWSEFVSPVPF